MKLGALIFILDFLAAKMKREKLKYIMAVLEMLISSQFSYCLKKETTPVIFSEIKFPMALMLRKNL